MLRTQVVRPAFLKIWFDGLPTAVAVVRVQPRHVPKLIRRLDLLVGTIGESTRRCLVGIAVVAVVVDGILVRRFHRRLAGPPPADDSRESTDECSDRTGERSNRRTRCPPR